MKKRTKKEDKFSSTEVGVLIDQLRSEFRAFGEGLSDLREKFDAITGMVAKNSEKLTWTHLEILAINDRLVKIDGKLARIEDSLKIKVDRKEFQILEKKVASSTN